jgi:predicted homoserine dehydrogenase-like protein
MYHLLEKRAQAGRPIRVGLIGAGKFGSMFLAQARAMPGLHLLGVADLSAQRAHAALGRTGWPAEQTGAPSFAGALATGSTHVTDDPGALIAADGLDVVVDATGAPEAGVQHALESFRHGRHIVMVNVEADVLAGPALARRAAAAGVVYSLAYGDQPALIVELVDWARICGFRVMAAGKGTQYLPIYESSTPDTVWHHWGITEATAEAAGMNPKMFNSFLDGTKSAIEMAAVANATGLGVPTDGLAFPPCGTENLATVLRPAEEGGALRLRGQVEVVSSLERDGRPVTNDLRWGVYVVVEAPTEYTRSCFRDYGMAPDPSCSYAAMYRPYHLVGLEVGYSVVSAAVRGEPTGAARSFAADVVAVARRDLRVGEVLDGEGGYTVRGHLQPARAAATAGALPIGLAHGRSLRRPVAGGAVVTVSDVDLDETLPVMRLRREMAPD